MICNTLKSLEDEDERKIDWIMVKKFLRILIVLLIIYTTLYITFFKCFLVLNDSITRTPQIVTLSSEGPANEMYPDSMGEYQLAEEENLYRHKNREDKFLMFNKLGNIFQNFVNHDIFDFYLQIIVGTSPSPIRQRMSREPSEVFSVVKQSTLSFSGTFL